jgi:hypothetical protein
LRLDVDHLAVQGGHAIGRHQTGLHRERVHRLDEVVVGAGIHAFEDLLAVAERGDQHDVDVAVAQFLADTPAQLRALDARHHPVGEQDVEALGRQQLPGARAVRRDLALMAELGGDRLEHQATGGVVVGDEDAHVSAPRPGGGRGHRGHARTPRRTAPPARGGVELLEPALQLHFGADVGQARWHRCWRWPRAGSGRRARGPAVAHLDGAGQLAAPFFRLRKILVDDLAEHHPFPVVEAAQQFELGRVERIEPRPVL